MHLKAFTPYKFPDEAAVHFLDVDLETLTTDEMTQLAVAPYQDENWARLANSVSTSAFRPYFDENFAGIIERKTADSSETAITTTSPVNCLHFDTSYRSPGTCDWSREFKFFSGGHFLGGIGVYAIMLSERSTLEDKKRSITSIARYSLQSGNPFNRLLIAVIKPDNWEIAFAQLKPKFPPIAKMRNCRVDSTLFRNPSEFIRAISSGLKVKDVAHEQHKSWFEF